MKKFLLLIVSLLLTVSAFAGTSVGNFNFKNQPEFDFRVGFPTYWNWNQESSCTDKECWRLTNLARVGNASESSAALFTFITGFPAKTDAELLKQLQILHPTFRWKPIHNPDFTIGYASEQEVLSPTRTHSFEYYFSQKTKVVRVEIFRDTHQNGATEIDTIISTIRRPSVPPEILSLDAVNKNQTTVKIGETFCYRLAVDRLRTDFNEKSLSDFTVKGTLRHWDFKDITWNEKASTFDICLKPNERFDSKGLEIKELSISLGTNTGSDLNCKEVESQQKGLGLKCGKKLLSYKAPVVENSNPQKTPPKVMSVARGKAPGSLILNIQSTLPLNSAHVLIDSQRDATSAPESMIIYQEQLHNGNVEVTFDVDRLPAGFTRIIEINLVDKVGNASRLKAEMGAMTYKRYVTDGEPEETTIPVISLMGEEK